MFTLNINFMKNLYRKSKIYLKDIMYALVLWRSATVMVKRRRNKIRKLKHTISIPGIKKNILLFLKRA